MCHVFIESLTVIQMCLCSCSGQGANGKSGGRGRGNAAGDGVQMPISQLERASDLCNDLLKKAAEAQKYCAQLEHLDFSSDMVKFLKKFYEATMGIHNKVWPNVVAKVDQESAYLRYHGMAETLMLTFETRRKLASTMANAAKPKKTKPEATGEGNTEGEAVDLD